MSQEGGAQAVVVCVCWRVCALAAHHIDVSPLPSSASEERALRERAVFDDIFSMGRGESAKCVRENNSRGDSKSEQWTRTTIMACRVCIM